MTKSEAKKLPIGVYRLHWKTGGSSVASVGMNERGETWYAPANWISVPWYNWAKVGSAILIERSFADCDG